MPSAEFEPAISKIKRLQTYILDRTTTGIGPQYITGMRGIMTFRSPTDRIYDVGPIRL